ncbi:hypothetical protein [Terrihalobacillus insolitus]|uniref:hypothetical protein n=1 Tax=Terrihalobacillus insolitus TaxID=2950438 RepID=UPI00233FD4A9|nr:hypothetical protein [Terrihalobacillus insolitus]MDC3414757.1 hypothetical protein [Terrihalobacillus insolitus]
MVLNKKYGVWSTVISFIGIFLLIVSYSISPNPSSGQKVIIGLFFFTALGSMLMGIILGVIGIKKKEKGFMKYAGILIVLLLAIGLAMIPLLMGIFGF